MELENLALPDGLRQQGDHRLGQILCKDHRKSRLFIGHQGRDAPGHPAQERGCLTITGAVYDRRAQHHPGKPRGLGCQHLFAQPFAGGVWGDLRLPGGQRRKRQNSGRRAHSPRGAYQSRQACHINEIKLVAVHPADAPGAVHHGIGPGQQVCQAVRVFKAPRHPRHRVLRCAVLAPGFAVKRAHPAAGLQQAPHHGCADETGRSRQGHGSGWGGG